MSKVIHIKLTKIGSNFGPFNIYDQWGILMAEDVTRDSLIEGIDFTVADNVVMIKIVSTGDCSYEKTVSITKIDAKSYFDTPLQKTKQGCIWRHLYDPELYNHFYGKVKPYMIEYPFAYQFKDQILQNIKVYSKVYRYTKDEHGVTNEVNKVELDDVWFNKSVIYNGQQSSGMLKLVPKPRRNLKDYMNYPIYNTDSKTILFTKSDNFYQYNTFWNIVRDTGQPLFVRTCKPLSYDKEVNQSNMDYGLRSFKKATIRAKDLKIRHILDDRSDVHLVSQFIVAPSQISYK